MPPTTKTTIITPTPTRSLVKMLQTPTTTTTLREYQRRALELAKSNSAIIVLPTGSGKTLIAASVIVSVGRCLFLVPSCLLVKQQADAIRYETKLNVVEYMGGASIPSSPYNVMVTTPAAFISLNAIRPEFAYSTFALIVFDEIHHVIKQHPYRTIALHLLALPDPPQILGLSASLTYAIGADRIQNVIESLCTELRIDAGCIFTATPQQLIDDGYHAGSSSAINMSDDVTLQEEYLQYQAVEIPGQPHEGLQDFLRHVTDRIPPIHDISIALMSCITSVEGLVRQAMPSFKSPIGLKGKLGRIAVWGKVVKKLSQKRRTSVELIRRFSLLEHLYESARLIINSRQCALELAMYYLDSMKVLDRSAAAAHEPCLLPMIDLWALQQSQFSRLDHLKQVLIRQSSRFGRNTFRCIVFVQQRLTTHVIHHFLQTDLELSTFKAECLYSTSSPATASLSVSPTQAKARIALFASGGLHILIATSVAEEGMDIPSANCVIRFDSVQTPVSLVQSRGRARQQDSSFIVMQEANKRPIAVLESAEQEQVQAIAEINANGFQLD